MPEGHLDGEGPDVAKDPPIRTGQTGFMPKRWVQNKILLSRIGLSINEHGIIRFKCPWAFNFGL